MNQHITPVMIIGAMKSGTSSLYDHLTRHPEICGGKLKEPEYFSLQMGDSKNKQGRYYDLFNIDDNQHRFILDGSTGYTKYPHEKGVPDRIKAYGLNPYFIYIIRNPLERIRSHYNFMMKNINWDRDIDSPNLINTSKYFMQLQQYEKVFSRSRIIIVDFDRLKGNPAELCNEIFQFIGAKKVKITIDENAIKYKTPLVNKKYLFIKKKLIGIKFLFPSFLKSWLINMLNILFPGKQEQLSEMQKIKIKKLLLEDISNLRDTYNFNVEKWGF